jgi:hypothetical protein
LKSVDEILNLQPKQFLKHVASFGKRNSASVPLEVGGEHLVESCVVADEFSNHFQSVYNNPCPVVFPTLSSSSEFLSLAPVCDSDIFKAIKRLRPSGSVVVDNIPGFIFDDCTDIFVCLFLNIF